MSSIKFDDKGLKKLQKDLEKAAKSISGKVSVDKLLTSNFMRKYTNFSNFEELLKKGNFIVDSAEDFAAIPDALFDEHIRKTTKFNNWDDMITEAGKEYAAKAFNFK